MAVSFNNAISAYQRAAQQVLAEGTKPAAAEPGPDAATFAGLVRDSLKSAIGVNKGAEQLSLKGIAGEADMRDVVLAVNNAEQALNTVVAVRDKVITAYQEILKMPI